MNLYLHIVPHVIIQFKKKIDINFNSSLLTS